MAECNWDPSKHNGKPCPVHGAGGENPENRDQGAREKTAFIQDLYARGFDNRDIISQVKDEFGEDIDEEEIREHIGEIEDEPFDDDNDFEKWGNNDIELNINEEDFEFFAEDVENSDVDFELSDVAAVDYCEPAGFDGGYRVTLKDGTVREYGWYDGDLEPKIYPVGENKFYRVIIGDPDDEEYRDFDSQEEAMKYAQSNSDATFVRGIPTYDPDDYGEEYEEEEVWSREDNSVPTGRESYHNAKKELQSISDTKQLANWFKKVKQDYSEDKISDDDFDELVRFYREAKKAALDYDR